MQEMPRRCVSSFVYSPFTFESHVLKPDFARHRAGARNDAVNKTRQSPASWEEHFFDFLQHAASGKGTTTSWHKLGRKDSGLETLKTMPLDAERVSHLFLQLPWGPTKARNSHRTCEGQIPFEHGLTSVLLWH